MNKNTKLFFIIFIGLAIILIFIVNLMIKRYEKETIPVALPKQEEIESKEPLKEKQDISKPEEIEQEGLVSGPLIY